MKKSIFLSILFAFTLMSVHAQTVIDLDRGGLVRSKTVEDYRREDPVRLKQMQEDSVAYNDCLNRALNAMYRDSLEEAEMLLQRALKLRPTAPSNPIVHHYMARIDMARGNFRSAAEKLSVLLKQNPDDKEVRCERASCYIELGNPKMALEDCQSLLRNTINDEERVRYLFLRVAAYDALKLYQKEKEDLQEILQISPAYPSAQLLLALVYAKLGQQEEAMNRLNHYISAHPTDAEGFAARAEIEAQTQKYELARADYDTAIRLSPQQPAYLFARAAVLEQLGLTAAARRDREEAQKLSCK